MTCRPGPPSTEEPVLGPAKPDPGDGAKRRRGSKVHLAGRPSAASFFCIGIGVATAIVWVGRAREGERSARQQGQPKPSKLDPHREFLLGLVAAEPDITIAEMQERLRTEAGVTASVGTIWTFLDRAGLTVEKDRARASEQERADVLSRREAWLQGPLALDPAHLIFIDETWASTDMARRRGRAPRGERLRAAIPHGHWKTTTFVAGLRRDGIAAPMVLDGPINRDAFQA